MKTIFLSLLVIFGISYLSSHAVDWREAHMTAADIGGSLKSVYTNAKSYISKQYYTQSIKHSLDNQEEDYEDFMETYELAPTWKKAWLFVPKMRAKYLNSQITEKGAECLELLDDDDLDLDNFKEEHEQFLELRNRFIARYGFDSYK